MINIRYVNPNVIIDIDDAFSLTIRIHTDYFSEILFDLLLVADGNNSSEALFAYKRITDRIESSYAQIFTILNTEINYNSSYGLNPSFVRDLKAMSMLVDVENNNQTNQQMNNTKVSETGHTGQLTVGYNYNKEISKSFIDMIFNRIKTGDDDDI